jgi:hypothetical protein
MTLPAFVVIQGNYISVIFVVWVSVRFFYAWIKLLNLGS